MDRTNITVLKQLVDELMTICNENGLDLFAVTGDAESLLKGTLKDERVFAVDFAVYAEGYDKVFQALGQRPGRVAEDLRTNSGMRGIGIRYSDIETTFFDPELPGRYLCNGLHINVLPMIRRPKKTMGDKILNYEERLWEDKAEKAFARAFFKVLGEKRMGRNLLEKQLKRSKSAKGKYTLHFPGQAICDIAKTDLKEAETIEYNQNFVSIFPKSSAVYQRYHRHHNLAKKYSLMSARVAWDDMMKQCGGTFTLQDKGIQKAIQKRETGYLQARRDVEKYWNLIELTFDRFRFYDRYCKGSEETEADLSEYLQALDYYSRRNLALCFDPDYFERALKAIKEQSGQGMAKKILEEVKLEHLESVEEYEKRMEKGEPLSMQMCKARYEAIGRSLGEAK